MHHVTGNVMHYSSYLDLTSRVMWPVMWHVMSVHCSVNRVNRRYVIILQYEYIFIKLFLRFFCWIEQSLWVELTFEALYKLKPRTKLWTIDFLNLMIFDLWLFFLQLRLLKLVINNFYFRKKFDRCKWSHIKSSWNKRGHQWLWFCEDSDNNNITWG